MNAEILSVGTELLLGDIVNSNTQYIAKGLAELGINLYRQGVVGDNLQRLKENIRESLDRADLLIITGGLGPTDDDLTREAVAEVLGKGLVLNEEILQNIRAFFDGIEVTMEDSNKKQAYLPEGALAIENPQGTSPGILIENQGKSIFLLPGPPKEMQPMFDDHVRPYLQQFAQGIVKSKVLNIFGIGESTMEAMVQDLITHQHNPSIAPYCMDQGLILRLTARASGEEEADRMIEDLESKVRDRLGSYIYGVDQQSLESVVVRLLQENQLTLSVAESCTGGLVSSMITNVPGASKVFALSMVTYTGEAKALMLGVPEDTLSRFGAVSEETAIAMAKAVRRKTGSPIGLSVTGIAGPDAAEDKPVGLVHMVVDYNGKILHQKRKLFGDRSRIRHFAAKHALNLVRTAVSHHEQ